MDFEQKMKLCEQWFAEDFKIDMGESESWNRLCILIDGERNHDVPSLHLIN